MANIEYLIRNIPDASEDELRINENEIKTALIASDDFMKYSALAERLGIEPSTDVEKHMLERAEVERSRLNLKRKDARFRIKERAPSILRDFNRSEVYLKGLVTRVYGTTIRGFSVDNLGYGELVNIGESILEEARRDYLNKP